MKIVDMTMCIRVTMENDMCGMESYFDLGSKVCVTFRSGKTFTGYVQRVNYGYYPGEDDLLILKSEDGKLWSLITSYIADIEEL